MERVSGTENGGGGRGCQEVNFTLSSRSWIYRRDVHITGRGWEKTTRPVSVAWHHADAQHITTSKSRRPPPTREGGARPHCRRQSRWPVGRPILSPIGRFPRFSILHSTNRVQSLALNQESQCPGVRYNKNRYIFFFDGNPGMAAQTVRCRRVVADKSQVTRPVKKEEFPTQRQGTARAVFFDVRDSEGRPFPKWRNNRLVSARQVTRTICDAQVPTSLKTPPTTTALLHTTAPLTSIQSRALLSTRNIKRERERVRSTWCTFASLHCVAATIGGLGRGLDRSIFGPHQLFYILFIVNASRIPLL